MQPQQPMQQGQPLPSRRVSGAGAAAPVAHDHSAPLPLDSTRRRRVSAVLAAIVLPLVALTIVGLVALWPTSVKAIHSQPLLDEGAARVQVVVTSMDGKLCPSDMGEPDQVICARNDAGKLVPVYVPPEARSAIRVGDALWAVRTAARAGADDAGGSGLPPSSYIYQDMVRELPLALLGLVYLVVVGAVAWHKGLLALLGLGTSVAVIMLFVVPGLMAGGPPLLVTLVGVSAMILASVYLAHGVSIKTTTALLGTYFGLGLTTLLALGTTRGLHLHGTGEYVQSVFQFFPGLSLSTLVTCGIVIAGLGALNDVTITQASTVWELYAAAPGASRWAVFRSAMRVGRDHIASTVYTLAFAYAGSALPMLMMAMMVDRSATSLVASSEIAEELARTLVASIGLVLAIPATTALGAALLPRGRNE